MNALHSHKHFTRAITEQVLCAFQFTAPFRCYGCDLQRHDEVAFCADCDEITASYVMERAL